MIKFNEFLELSEELNYRITNDIMEFENRWFYYSSEDEMVYGCDNIPSDALFSFNPVSCKVVFKGDEYNYDVSNPICVISLKMDDSNEFLVYTDKTMDFLKDEYHYNGIDLRNDRGKLQDFLDEDEEHRVLIMYGKELIASTFDIIEEN